MKKRITIATLWLILPLLGVAYHYGPGQKLLALDKVDDLLEQSDQQLEEENWSEAIELLNDALAKLPKDETEAAQQIKLQIAKAKMMDAKLPEARADLAALVQEINDNPTASEQLKEDALSSLANARYYMTYLMKLEGRPDSDWEPEIEAARQEYKLLAQNSSTADKHLLDLEASIRLARATPRELYGLPLPSQ
ncbi:hypothetical protein SAMN02745181_3008 [Rubritalea squalenifaciens DSM 18772]|uniref:Tetratricopeptide repeat-containing protein n=2 Tax=Rubritalea TaxID=361050 RepID=A0A1M6NXM9_9BACT|nr:hypothetical protein [Rubritalea squalenifaciens]SHK00499.1 hypothetical protein SAMN02745181_3008 [Rubritalea squalenifaciens DSM 18772]